MNDTEFFHEATRRICGSLDAEIVLQQCLEFLADFIPADGMIMSTAEESAEAIHIIGGVSHVPSWDLNNSIPITSEVRAYMQSVRSGVTIIESPDSNPVAKAFYQAIGLSSVSALTLILEIDARRMGVVAFLAQGTNCFTPEHARLLTLLHDPFAIAVVNTAQHREIVRLKELLTDDNRFLRRQLYRASGDKIVGERFGLRDVMEQVHQVASLNTPVLLNGETGVGKEVIANAIHYSSDRRDGPLVKVNCGAIPDNLLDSELFGHERGAFTGALALKRGRFERANKGTLFLDEIGELPPAAQVRLLRVLQTGEFERVGGTKPIEVDARIIAATHRNLEAMIASGDFREDLWFRLNVFPVYIPPLRRRKADIPALALHFIERKVREMNLPAPPALAPGAVERLKDHDWPGNVRELENVVERALIRSLSEPPGTPLRFEAFSGARFVDEPIPLNILKSFPTLDEVTGGHIRKALDLAEGKVQGSDGAAALLGVNPSTLRNRMRKLGIAFGKRK